MLSGFITALSYLPWLNILLTQTSDKIVENSSISSRTITDLKDLLFFSKIGLFSSDYIPNNKNANIYLTIMIVITIFSIIYFIKLIKNNKSNVKKVITKDYIVELFPLIGICIFITTIAIGLILSLFTTQGFLIRYAFPGLVLLTLWLSTGLKQLNNKIAIGSIFILMTLLFTSEYKIQLEIENTDGLDIFNSYIDTNIDENDWIIGPTEHTVFLSINHPKIQFFQYGYKSPFMPFKNVDAFREWHQLDHLNDYGYYVCFRGDRPDVFNNNFTYELVLEFNHMYYGFDLFKLTPINK